jgi:hypothetical protein
MRTARRLILIKCIIVEQPMVHMLFLGKETKMRKDAADKGKRAVLSQSITNNNDTVRTASGQEKTQRWLQDALEDDEVREALKSLHSDKTG